MPNSPDFKAWASERQERVEGVLDRLLPPEQLSPAQLHQAMRYAVLGGGKRVRPLLAFAAGEIAGAEAAAVEPVAAAVEFIHAYSLVHDDLPCMDNDSLRRGRPTCHVAFDEATALLVGDALQSLAFQVLCEQEDVEPGRRVEMVSILARAVGSRGMAGGQALDLASTGQELSLPELENMHIHKTGELIRAAVLLGARVSGMLAETSAARLDHAAKCAGLAFQVVDDVLDAESDTQTLGKTAGKDARQDKPTYVSVLGPVQAKRFAVELRDEAWRALEMFDDKALRMRQLIDFIVLRRS
ncbi:MAG TPA: farnesyl diphosphate synthase [Burkholderiales bacterium]|nr:farnesyl diphosphate synthase [Burkholderiales bacterium]